MAGEIRGKIAEALTLTALRAAFGKEFTLKSWDEPVKGLRWKPDLLCTVGQLEVLFLVNWSGSETHSKEKFWRNLSEATEAKIAYPGIRIVAVTFKARMRQKLAKASEELFEGYVTCQQASFCDYSRALMSRCRSSAQTAIEEVVAREVWATASPTDRQLFVSALRGAVVQGSSPAGLWRLLRGQSVARMPDRTHALNITQSITAFASALPIHQKMIIGGVDRLKSNEVPSYYRRVGLVTPGIGCSVARPVQEVLRLLGADEVERISRTSITPTGESAISVLRAEPLLEAQGAFVRENISRIRDEVELKGLFLECFENPRDLLEPYVGATGDLTLLGSGCWLYSYLKNLMAAATARQGQEWIEEVSEISGVMRSILVGLVFPPFERGEKLPNENDLQAIARVFSSRCHAYEQRLPKLHAVTVDELLSTTISNRLFPHGFKVLDAIVSNAVKDAGFVDERRLIRSAVSEYCALDKKTTSTTFIEVNGVLIHTKVVTQQGRDHKVKELFGRSAMTHVAYLENCWSKRDLRRLILVIDGEVGTGELEVLKQSWWTDVFYPDEMDKLAAAIV